MRLKDKVFIITGATSGMGKAIALLFAQEGANLIVNGRNTKKGNELLTEINSLTESTIFLPGDVGNVAINQQLVNQAIAKFGKLDGIVANAGVLGLGSITEIAIEEWHSTLNTNINSFFYLCKYAIPHIQKSEGVVIANASIAAFRSFPNHPAYCASKAALVALVKQAALDYGPEIRINAICPGPVETPLIWDSAQAFDNPEQAVENAGKSTPLKRLGTPMDVARLALFLASDEAAWMTGSAVTIDGGTMTSC